MRPHGWYPRPSSMGYYFSCDYRAALDRAIAEGVAPPEAVALFAAKQATPSPHADLGTCIHFTLQDGLLCEFGKPDAAPTPEQWANASLLFGGDLDRTHKAAFASATLAAAHLPKLPDGQRWRAEVPVSNSVTQGTIDLLSPDGEELWDLKTTSKPPLGGHLKAPHLYQVLTYRWLCKKRNRPMPKRGGVVYVDAVGAAWAHAIKLDFTDPAYDELTENIEQYARYMRSGRLFGQAVPSLGSHCSDDWCPYTGICRNRFLKPLSTGFTKSSPLPTAAPATLASLGKV